MSDHTKYYAEMAETVKAMTAPGKGLLAADESTGTIGKRFANISVENVEPNRQAYRQLLFTSPDWGKYCSGVILFEETLYQKHTDGTPFVDIIKKAGVVPGIKVDKGPVLVPGMKGDKRTQGADGLDERCKKYYEAGARFAKWRAVYSITEDAPTPQGIQINADGLACYALICQANGLVPIVEPEVLMDGPHSIERSYQVTKAVQEATFKALADWGVSLEHMILKPNMVVSGYDHKTKAGTAEVASWTLKCLRATVPPAVRGIMFLSGGQTETEATVNLNALNTDAGPKPWALSFSYGRALQASALKAWSGKADNVKAGQAAFLKRAQMNFNAAQGKYNPKDE